jgi:hypothetical protein
MFESEFFTPEYFHQISTYTRKKLQIQVGTFIINFSPEELMFLSSKSLEWYQRNTTSFKIEIPQDSALNEINISSALNDLKSLFVDKSEIIVSNENFFIFAHLAKSLDNYQLSKICNDVQFSKRCASFSLMFSSISQIKPSIFEKYDDFSIHIDDEIFHVNPVFMGMLSERIRDLFQEEENDLFMHVPMNFDKSQYLLLLTEVCSMLHGYLIDFSQFKAELLDVFSENFEITKLRKYYDSSRKYPEDLSEALQVLKKNVFSHVRNSAIDLISKNFSQIFDDDDLKMLVRSLSFDTLDLIFSSSNISLSNQNDLFDFVGIQKTIDHNAKILFKHIKLNFVDQ